MRLGNDVLHGVDRAERVGYVRDGQQPNGVVHERVKRVEFEFAPVVDRRNDEFGPGLLADQLPGNDVGVMLEMGDEHLVAGAELRPAEALRDEVDGFRRAAGEYHLARAGRIDERAERFASAFVGVGRPVTQRMHATVHVGVVVTLVA